MSENSLYMKIAKKFTELLCKDNIKGIVLDGSVNNSEDIVGYSDIDIKVFVEGDMIPSRVFQNINKAIRESLEQQPITFNAWTLLEKEYPITVTPAFDFVRRYCLLCGSILHSNDFIQSDSKDLLYITRNEQIACLTALANFQIRLRRLLTNPTAISDVSRVSVSFILQQSIAYVFHALRYYNAFNGYMCCSIKDVYQTFQSNNKYENLLINDIMELRSNWNNVQFTMQEAVTILFKTISLLDCLADEMRSNLTDTKKNLIYI